MPVVPLSRTQLLRWQPGQDDGKEPDPSTIAYYFAAATEADKARWRYECDLLAPAIDPARIDAALRKAIAAGFPADECAVLLELLDARDALVKESQALIAQRRRGGLHVPTEEGEDTFANDAEFAPLDAKLKALNAKLQEVVDWADGLEGDDEDADPGTRAACAAAAEYRMLVARQRRRAGIEFALTIRFFLRRMERQDTLLPCPRSKGLVDEATYRRVPPEDLVGLFKAIRGAWSVEETQAKN